MCTNENLNEDAGGGSVLNIELERDARRYRKLRRLAVDHGCLESTVALAQLDFVRNADKFDEDVDALKDTGLYLQ